MTPHPHNLCPVSLAHTPEGASLAGTLFNKPSPLSRQRWRLLEKRWRTRGQCEGLTPILRQAMGGMFGAGSPTVTSQWSRDENVILLDVGASAGYGYITGPGLHSS